MRRLIGSIRRKRIARPAAAVALGLAAAAGAPARQGAFTIADVGFQAPECVRYDARADVYLVASVNGGPAARDGNGFISRVAPDGRVLALRWIEGGRNGAALDAPKGMAFHGDTLFVADLSVVRVFDRRTGRPLGSRPVPGATFLNDVAVARDGSLYVTDTGFRAGAGGGMEASGTDALYRFDRRGAAVAVARGRDLGNPNGVAAHPLGGVLVVAAGTGAVYRVDAAGRRTDLAKPPRGGLDGVAALPDGTLLASSWEGEAVYRLGRDGRWTEVATAVPSPAAIGYDARRNRLLIPQMTLNRVQVRPLAPAPGSGPGGHGR
ncbi:MAG: SMP-30/Gluconolaconase/LRE-like region-containing protein [Gemmatimonadetes bacterium]|nr:SMP-30/Gluconolaconase/LRE-like region-containing protein [Gemmatimonadota bacterium]